MLREAGAPPVCPLGKASTERYSRQLLVPDVGVEGHTRIGACSVLVVGAGGLGSPCALYLAGAGVGKIGLMDGDVVEESNLHRQVMHTEARVGEKKAVSGAAACKALNSMVSIEVHEEFLRVGEKKAVSGAAACKALNSMVSIEVHAEFLR
ncbi:hypothetical protein T484DRAFT_1837643 [Baffinella frigidus]|nr:hypothetical protein T484DRAFT_1837643 [Cryptophyta sp. CCMP2293]